MIFVSNSAKHVQLATLKTRQHKPLVFPAFQEPFHKTMSVTRARTAAKESLLLGLVLKNAYSRMLGLWLDLPKLDKLLLPSVGNPFALETTTTKFAPAPLAAMPGPLNKITSAFPVTQEPLRPRDQPNVRTAIPDATLLPLDLPTVPSVETSSTHQRKRVPAVRLAALEEFRLVPTASRQPSTASFQFSPTFKSPSTSSQPTTR